MKRVILLLLKLAIVHYFETMLNKGIKSAAKQLGGSETANLSGAAGGPRFYASKESDVKDHH